jgi:dihydroorotate dehydrogenase
MNLYPLILPLLSPIDPETAHGLAIRALASGLGRACLTGGRDADDPILATRVWQLDFPNPVGLAAGFDKHAEVCDAVLDLGFGFTEAGTVTPKPQPGNPRPRLFRLTEDAGVINRFGFNSQGLEPFVARLAGRQRRGIVGANVGKNKTTEDPSADYITCIEQLARLADYLVVNISSPNTPGLRALQARALIAEVLERSLEARERACAGSGLRPPMLVKIAPDLEPAQFEDIAQVALSTGIDGITVSNTSTDRPPLRSAHRDEAGGLSGKPIAAKARAALHRMYELTGGRIPLVGSGGIDSGAEAYARIRAGASLIQFYSAMVFQGPGLVNTIKRDLAACLRADGFASVADAVGADHRPGRSA